MLDHLSNPNTFSINQADDFIPSCMAAHQRGNTTRLHGEPYGYWLGESGLGSNLAPNMLHSIDQDSMYFMRTGGSGDL